jgi:hypothetical protein
MGGKALTRNQSSEAKKQKKISGWRGGRKAMKRGKRK